MACTSTPPNDGPPTWVTALVPEVRLLRATSSLLDTIDGRKAALPTSKTTPASPMTSGDDHQLPAARSTPSHATSGMDDECCGPYQVHGHLRAAQREPVDDHAGRKSDQRARRQSRQP